MSSKALLGAADIAEILGVSKSKQRIWSPIYRREVIKYDAKTRTSNDGAFEWG